MPAPGLYRLIFGPFDGEQVNSNGKSMFVFCVDADIFYRKRDESEMPVTDLRLCELTYRYSQFHATYIFHSIDFVGNCAINKNRIKCTISPNYDSTDGIGTSNLMLFNWKYYVNRKGSKNIEGAFKFSSELLNDITSFSDFAKHCIKNGINKQRYERKKAARKAKGEGAKG